MIKVNIYQAKMNLSKYLRKLSEGESIVLCKRNEPIAEIRLLKRPRTKNRPVGLAKGQFKVPSSFFESLPAQLVKAFRGNGS